MMIEEKKPKPRLRRELTKNGRAIGAKLTQSEHDEWVKLGKAKWLRAFLKDSRFERQKMQQEKNT